MPLMGLFMIKLSNCWKRNTKPPAIHTVPKVNKELWQAFKTARPADLAMQACQKYMALAMVPIIKTLDIFVNNGDKDEVK
ncbi:hypothetical protein DPMN_124741 [Dreissena polymorpha]|uniref:Uncharacterized protein n=1 Tax=Dreissena polymorpha TaxID=45954 RepID=A0A9D4H021_DREPO|nr:hypothetical protein DPMN_124741 [Dreissena polymorpha]